MGIFEWIYKWGMRHEARKLGKANLRLATCVLHYLNRKYISMYGKQTAPWLAIAVTNEVYDTPSNTPDVRQFIASNNDLIEKEFCNIRQEVQICHAVTLYANMMANISARTGSMTPEIIRWLDKLSKHGILIPIEKGQMPASLADFVNQIEEFECWCNQTAANQ